MVWDRFTSDILEEWTFDGAVTCTETSGPTAPIPDIIAAFVILAPGKTNMMSALVCEQVRVMTRYSNKRLRSESNKIAESFYYILR